MPYIARTDGGSEVLDLKVGIMSDIPVDDQSNWRPVVDAGDTVADPLTEVKVATDLVVNEPYVNLVWVKYPLPPMLAKSRLKDHAAAKRWQHSQSGLTLPNGVIVDTSDTSKAKVHQALSILEKGWAASVEWKAKNGRVVLDLAGITAVSQAMAAFEQACFAAEFAIIDAIDAGTLTTKAEIDAYAWP